MFAFFDQVMIFFHYILTFITSGLYDFVIEGLAKLVIFLTIGAIEFKIFMLEISWDVAKQILETLNISATIQSALNTLDSKIMNFLTFLRIPEFINIIFAGYTTRYVLSLVGL